MGTTTPHHGFALAFPEEERYSVQESTVARLQADGDTCAAATPLSS